MKRSRRFLISLGSALVLVFAAVPCRAADAFPRGACDLLAREEQSRLEEAKLAVTLAHADFDAFEQIMELIQGLWDAEAIERMSYLRAKYDRDAARLALEEAELLLQRQSALVEQLGLACDTGGSEKDRRDRNRLSREVYLRYRRADCDALSKAIEVASTNLKFNRELLQNTRNLREGNVATKPQVILAELAVAREEAKLADAKRRATVCLHALARLEGASAAD